MRLLGQSCEPAACTVKHLFARFESHRAAASNSKTSRMEASGCWHLLLALYLTPLSAATPSECR
eukprot:1856685-Rhodomonas_salina.1